LAYRHLLLAVAEHRTPTVIEADRQRSRLKPIGLSDTDQANFRQLLSDLRDQLDAIQQVRDGLSNGSTAPGPNAPTMAGLQAQEDELFSATISSLPTKLSTSGMTKLGQYVQQQVKPSILIYGTSGPVLHGTHQN
jgi:hypothetical protein